MEKLVRNVAAGYLLCLILLKVLAVPLLLMNYEANKDFIAAKFCVNKTRPAMNCNGKCHLSKQLAKAAESAPSSEKTTVNQAQPGTDFVEYFIPFRFEENSCSVTHGNLFFDDRFTVYSLNSIFHPPVTLA